MRALILAAGKGTRMRSEKAKVLHEVMGRPMLACVLDVLKAVGVRKTAVVAGAHANQVREFLMRRSFKNKSQRSEVILQKVQRGTGHAVMTAKNFFSASSEDLLIWPGDMPLLKTGTIRAFLKQHQASGSAVSVLSAVVENPKGYGRILREEQRFFAIREELDASETEKRVCEINTGIYLFKIKPLKQALSKLKSANAKNEFYLTDTIEILASAGESIQAFPLAAAGEAEGINSRAQLAGAMKIMNQNEIMKHMDRGVTLVDPAQTYIEPGAKIGPDTVIYPWCYLESGIEIGKNCRIGPFAKIRKGSRIGDGSVIGSFVEVNRSRLGAKVSAKHLAYIGDAVIGPETNIGAGTITANFDGKKKHQTYIGKQVLIGSNTVLIAPVTIEDGARTGAGAVVTSGSRVTKGMTVVGVPAKEIPRKSKS
ncbi:MAG: bifunctional N-acetylglucosamine-1-phosphate uridyltransferase/glucosamine-1-phosphate acetyltransferase [Candidatus Omnitrophica bacterium]|nr:bifunctional N-acetylglucosamine-1-phosphate uridyltransferase/glucosamine-1-phosphate acetyltransferase [Candidatus Omnitrophota bacterium]